MRTVRVQVNGQEADSLSACVWAALSHWGQPVAYDCVAGLSGAAFCPALRTTESCAAWWMESRSDARLEFLGHALGFAVEPSPDLRHADDRARFGARARRALAAGDVVLCASWPCWSLVAEWRDEPGRMGLAPPSGLEGVCQADEAARLYILRPAQRTLTRCEALRDALRFAAAAANGHRQEEGLAYGGELYAAWQGRLRQEQFCPDCGDNDWRCAQRTARRARGCQASAAHFLSRASALLPPLAGNDALQSAEGAYLAMAHKLTPYAANGGLNGEWLAPEVRAGYAQDVADVGCLHQEAARNLSQLACRL